LRVRSRCRGSTRRADQIQGTVECSRCASEGLTSKVGCLARLRIVGFGHSESFAAGSLPACQQIRTTDVTSGISVPMHQGGEQLASDWPVACGRRRVVRASGGVNEAHIVFAPHPPSSRCHQPAEVVATVGQIAQRAGAARAIAREGRPVVELDVRCTLGAIGCPAELPGLAPWAVLWRELNRRVARQNLR
jgi:hypothetical protein